MRHIWIFLKETVKTFKWFAWIGFFSLIGIGAGVIRIFLYKAGIVSSAPMAHQSVIESIVVLAIPCYLFGVFVYAYRIKRKNGL